MNNATDTKMKEKKKLHPYAMLSAIIAVIIALAIVLGACLSFFMPKTVMSYRGVSIDSEMYCFWFSYYKMQLMSSHGIKGASDTPEFWRSEISDGLTYGEYFTKIIDDRIKAKVITSYMYDSLGASLPDYGKREIEEYMSDMLDYVSDGDKKEFEKVAEKYHTSYKAIRKVASCDYKAELLFTLNYGDGTYVTEEQKTSYYNSEFSRVKVIFVNTKTKTVQNGENTSTQPLTQDEILEKKEIAANLEAKLVSDATDYKKFEELMAIYSDDSASTYYENGFYLSANSDYPVSEVIASALSLTEGTWEKVESSYGIHFIMKYPLDEKGYENEQNSDWFDDFESDVAMIEFDKTVKENIDLVKINEKNKSKWTIESIKYNYEINPIITD